MRLALYTTGKPRELKLAEALHLGGHHVAVMDAGVVDWVDHVDFDRVDFHCVMGVTCGDLWRALKERGARCLFWDKGYNRDWPEWWRVSYGAHQPTRYIGRARWGAHRAEAQGWIERFEPLRIMSDGHVLIAGGSPNYHEFVGLPDPTAWAQSVVDQVRAVSSRPILYRPKPQWRDAVAIVGAEHRHSPVKVKGERIQRDLVDCHVMITHGSSACLEAMFAGVPTICLGDAPLREFSDIEISAITIALPRPVTEGERLQAVSNIAYCQWSLQEITEGAAWPFIMDQVEFVEGKR